MRERSEVVVEVERLLFRLLRCFRPAGSGDLTPAQFFLLRRLEDAGELSMGKVAEILGVTLAAATGVVDRLVRAGMLERRPGKADRRVVLVALTAAGAERLAEARRRKSDAVQRLLEVLSDRDLLELARILGLLVAQGEGKA